MKKILMLLILLSAATSISAQQSEQSEDAKTLELRQKIGIDYNLPDFSTSKLDPKIIGARLSKMLCKLQDNYHDPVFNRKLSHIVCEQNPNLKYVTIDKFSIKNISKSGNVMTIKANAKLGKNTSGVKTAEIAMSFDNGASKSQTINDLFSDLGRYIKE